MPFGYCQRRVRPSKRVRVDGSGSPRAYRYHENVFLDQSVCFKCKRDLAWMLTQREFRGMRTTWAMVAYVYTMHDENVPEEMKKLILWHLEHDTRPQPVELFRNDIARLVYKGQRLRAHLMRQRTLTSEPASRPKLRVINGRGRRTAQAA